MSPGIRVCCGKIDPTRDFTRRWAMSFDKCSSCRPPLLVLQSLLSPTSARSVWRPLPLPTVSLELLPFEIMICNASEAPPNSIDIGIRQSACLSRTGHNQAAPWPLFSRPWSSLQHVWGEVGSIPASNSSPDPSLTEAISPCPDDCVHLSPYRH
jgi:hypothetical protein